MDKSGVGGWHERGKNSGFEEKKESMFDFISTLGVADGNQNSTTF